MFGGMKRDSDVEMALWPICVNGIEMLKISNFFLKSEPKMPMSYMRGFNNQNDETPGALRVSGQVRR